MSQEKLPNTYIIIYNTTILPQKESLRWSVESYLHFVIEDVRKSSTCGKPSLRRVVALVVIPGGHLASSKKT